jgi:hypothetical protein
MTELEESLLAKLQELGGESSTFLITKADGPWGEMGDPDARMAAVNSLHDQGAVVYDTDKDIVTAA